MSERDELARVIFDAPVLIAWDGAQRIIADAILAAGYRKPRTITTAEELDGLSVGVVVRTAGHEEYAPRVAVKTLRFDSGVSYWHVADADDFESTSDELDDLPAAVLYEPTA